MKEKPCPMCLERGKPENFGSEPKCAFLSGVFSGDNWQCATMNALRDLAENTETSMRHEDSSMGFLPIPGEGQFPFLVMSWYKGRGRTSDAFCLCEGSQGSLTLEVAMRALSR